MVQALLGHSSSEITIEVYLHFDPVGCTHRGAESRGLADWTQVVQIPETGAYLIQ
jgi:hypothetical protein